MVLIVIMIIIMIDVMIRTAASILTMPRNYDLLYLNYNEDFNHDYDQYYKCD